MTAAGTLTYQERRNYWLWQATSARDQLRLRMGFALSQIMVVSDIDYNIRSFDRITDYQDLTDRHHGLRLVLTVKSGYDPEAVLQQLYRHTPLEESFGINNVALVEGQPRTLGLKQLLEVFVDHRITVVRRRTEYRLRKRLDRLHLVEGLLVAIVDIEVAA